MPLTMKLDAERPSEPDSTTVEKEILLRRDFAVNDEVLCHISRGDQLYWGVVVEVNHILKKCLVKFLDDTETWCDFKDMKFLNLREQEVTCVVCKTSHNKHGNQINVCNCGRGYHQLCHKPHIPMPDPNWRCNICSPTKKEEPEPRVERTPKKVPVVANHSTPPTFNWEAQSREPKQEQQQQQQCYCGQKGVWYKGMLQCRRCRQWFHSKCIRSIDHPIFYGDRFYVLICSGCNMGKEICVRLVLTWPDVVHLVLFNLMLLHHTKYYDLDSSIMPYVNRHWRDLKLPPAMAVMPLEERRRHVERALIGYDKRFKCGREVKKRTTLWSLRVRGAPRAPLVTLPPKGQIEESDLPMHIKKHLLLLPSEKPLQNGFINSSKKDIGSSRSVSPEESLSTESKVGSSTTEYHGCGLVKRSVPFPMTEQAGNADARFRSQAVRRAARMLRRRKPQTDVKRVSSLEENKNKPLPPSQDFSRSYVEFLSRREERKSKPEIKKRPQRNLLEARLNSTESKLYNPKVVVEDIRKRAPVPVNEPTNRKKFKKGESRKKAKRKLVQKTILETLQSKKWRSDAKPPDSCDRNDSGAESASSADEQPLRTPPTPVKPVITKRQLSEKDIVVDRNGQVRRRRRHRRGIPVVVPPLPPTPSPMVLRSRDVPEPPEELPVVDWNVDVDYETVQELFGVPDRIARGERYEITARRVRPDGRVEVTVEFPS